MTSPETQLLRSSAAQQAIAVRSGVVSATELVEMHLQRIAAINPSLNAAVEVLNESAKQAARETDERLARGLDMGPLAGVPFSVKDSFEVCGSACSAGTVGLSATASADKDAAIVARLRTAGGIPIARTNVPDLLFAFESDNLVHGRTNNPYDLKRTPGGSSGGEAALISACGSPVGLGSDAAGSVRLPAHFSGITSIKPTSGRLPRSGHVPPAAGWIESLWQPGPMARRVEDLGLVMPLLAYPDGLDPSVVGMPVGDLADVVLGDLRLAFFLDNGIKEPDTDTADTVQRAAEALARAVRSVRECRPPRVEESFDLEMDFLGPDGGDAFQAYSQSIGSVRTHALLDGWIHKLETSRTTVAGFSDVWARLDRFRSGMFRFLQDYDVILSPVAAYPALPHGSSIEESVFRGFSYTMTHNLTGWPAAVVRCGETSAGLPIGVQIAARPWREDVALRVAQFLEEAFGGWHEPEGLPI